MSWKVFFCGCFVMIVTVVVSPSPSVADGSVSWTDLLSIEEIFQPTLDSLGLPTDLTKIPGGTIRVSDSLDNHDVSFYSVVGCRLRFRPISGAFLEFFVPAGAHYGDLQIESIRFVINESGEKGWYLEYLKDLVGKKQIPIKVVFTAGSGK